MIESDDSHVLGVLLANTLTPGGERDIERFNDSMSSLEQEELKRMACGRRALYLARSLGRYA